ncbi:hypothetical protein GALMADRAFT_216466 [Galerina marginata CBS 339.88]|uniref:Uncharacterized protein n=1 Tax=Galerina marginata (strain CBS 339.88) TaxID=685588 RepID=A0A067SBP4_GALM3|nr:hypothetical protein GALMADRAFT_216466 [Galerina marginata CBS 339.88]
MVSFTPLLACCWASAVLAASSNHANDILNALEDQLRLLPRQHQAGFKLQIPNSGTGVSVVVFIIPALVSVWRLTLAYSFASSYASITTIVEEGWTERLLNRY